MVKDGLDSLLRLGSIASRAVFAEWYRRSRRGCHKLHASHTGRIAKREGWHRRRGINNGFLLKQYLLLFITKILSFLDL